MKKNNFPIIKRSTILFLFAGFLTVSTGWASEAKKAIIGAAIVNPAGKKSLKNAVILIEGNTIVKIGASGKVKIPKNAEVIDAKGKWIIPGLIDSHVHFFQSGGLYTRPDIINLEKYVSYRKEMEQIKNNLGDTFKRYLRSGITAVVDMGGPFWNFEVREKAKNTLLAPRVQVCGPLISTHHPAGLESDDLPIIKVNTIDEALALVKKQVDAGTDFIKIWYVIRKGRSEEEYFDLIKAVSDEAHRLGKKVIIHATALKTAKAAVRAGADILAHSVYDVDVDDEFIRLCKKKKVIYSTTIVVSEGYLEALNGSIKLQKEEYAIANPLVVATLLDGKKLLNEKQFTPLSAARVQQSNLHIAVGARNVKKMLAAGIMIAVNTDAGNIGTLPGPAIFREFELLARAGLTPAEILTGVTLNNARMMGMEKQIGSIENGKLADMVVLNSDPLKTIANTSDIFLVVKDGQLLKPSDILATTSEELVQQQDNAYNCGDIDAFMATYHPEINIYNFPDELRYSSWAEMKERYAKLFTENPMNHAEITKRISIGGYVVDEEKITGRADGNPQTAVAIYEIKDGLIYKVWFLKK